MESILTSIKKLLGIVEEYTQFDADLIMYINSSFAILTQIGVGPESGFQITDKSSVWSDFAGDDKQLIALIIPYISNRVRLMFDPPLSSQVMECMKVSIAEFEWRIREKYDLEKAEEGETNV